MNRMTILGAVTLAAWGGALMAQTDTATEGTATESAATQEAAPEAEAASPTETSEAEAAAEPAEKDTAATEAPTPEPNADGIYEMTLGNPDANVTVTEYASFTCPHCANFHKTTFKQLKSNYIDTGKIQFIYRDVYFDRPGLWAAMVARCDGPSRFFGISDMLYNQQRDWVSGSDPVAIADKLRKIGKVAGMGEEQLEACLTDAAKAEALVAWFQTNAEADDISSTPTLMINGEQHSNMSYEELSKILDEKLAE
ncbi:DsbA family protein [Roseovarius pelagicus]|uniref:DsbA family protein n=1 Tax=Roseovarius pelagicus TaxID=2980108 RepID=A0ABY6D685_9RHOB|nr:DsbA family protein [Roseovarius pelagicus]UXX81659.1 DsbA family protein [Roseovarius pelagicus]